ncbi:hypothetical protein JOM56_005349 [Amanita muscaria]
MVEQTSNPCVNVTESESSAQAADMTKLETRPKRPLARQRGYRDLRDYDPDDDGFPYSTYMLSQPAAISSLSSFQDQKEPDEHVKTPIVLPTNSLQWLFESQDSEYVKTPILIPADSLQWSLESEEDVKTPILIPSGPPQLREDDIEPLTI